MTKYILSFFLLLPICHHAQSLFRSPILDYLGSSLHEAGLTNGSTVVYNGLGKHILLENHPTSWGKGVITTFSPKGNTPLIFGSLTQLSTPTYKPVVQLSGSHFGEVDLMAKGIFKLRNVRNFFQINGHFFNHKLDNNKDNFVDLPLKKRLYLTNNSSFRLWQFNSNLKLFYFKLTTTGGDINFNKSAHYLKDAVYGFGNEVDHAGFKWTNRLDLAKQRTATHFLTVNFAGRLHQQDSYFGIRRYQGEENLLEGLVSYQREMLLSDLTIGLKYKYQNTQETLTKKQLNREESVLGLYANYNFLLSQNWQLRTFVNLDYHNLLDWEFHPSFKLNYTPNYKFKLGFFGGTGYQYANVLTENQSLLISARKVFIQKLAPTKAMYFGGAWQMNLSGIFNINRPTNWKLQYFYRIYDNQAIVDADQAVDELHFYNLEGKARRHVLENMFTYRWNRQLNFTAIYRLDLAKTTIDNQYRMMPFHSNHSLFLAGSYFLDRKFDIQLNYTLRSPQRIPNITEKSPVFHRLDALLEVPFQNIGVAKKWRPFTVFVGVENIFNQQQSDIYQNSNTPFESDFEGGMRWGRTVGIRVFGGVKYEFK